MATVIINISKVAGTPDCVATTDGQKVHDEIAASLRSGDVVHVSFAGVKSIITAFLNAAIGQLWGDFKDEEIAGRIFIVEAKPEDIEKVRRVVAGAKTFLAIKRSLKKPNAKPWTSGKMSNAKDIRSQRFTSADKILLDTNVWLFLQGPQGDPTDWMARVYSEALANC